MRMVAMVLGLALGSAPIVVLADGAGGGGRRVTRCCLELEMPGIPPGPGCVQGRGRHGPPPPLACRPVGGGPLRRGGRRPPARPAPPPGARAPRPPRRRGGG